MYYNIMYLYKISFLEKQQHKKAKHIIYYRNSADFEDLFDSHFYKKNLIRIEYIRVKDHEFDFIKQHIF